MVSTPGLGHSYFRSFLQCGELERSAAVLSALPDNPGDSRFWTVSPGLQIRVWNLPDILRSLQFSCRLDFPTINLQVFRVVWAILLLTSSVSSKTLVWYIMPQIFFAQMTSYTGAIWHHLSSLAYQFSIFEDVVGWQLRAEWKQGLLERLLTLLC